MESTRNNLKNNITKIKEKLNTNMEVVWENEYLKDWKTIAEEKQQFYLESLGGRIWEEYQLNEHEYLRLKIGFAIFGPLAAVEDENIDQPAIHFKNVEQKKTIDLIIEAIYKISGSDHAFTAFIFVIAFINNEYAEYPLIRVLNNKSNAIFFIDMLGRVYKDWNDFTDNNTFPSCICCYPKNGFYSCSKDGKVELSFGYSPESSKVKCFLRKIDSMNEVAGVGSAAIGIAALAVSLPAPLLLGSAAAGLASAVWSTCRTLNTLRDRRKHYQSLSVADRNARACWLSLAAGIIGGASVGAVEYTAFVARTGLTFNRLPCLAIHTLEVGNISIGGLAIINHLVNVMQKKECTPSDAVEVILSILFFFHATISFARTEAIMKDIKSKLLKNIENKSNINQQNEFIAKLQETWNDSLKEGNVAAIRSLKHIETEETFLQVLLGMGNASKDSIRNGPMILHEDKNICGHDFRSVGKIAEAKLMDNQIKLSSENKLIKDINAISKQENLLVIKNEISKKINVTTFNDSCIDAKQLIATASYHEIYLLHKTVHVIETDPKNGNALEKILKEVKKYARSVSLKNLHEFILLILSILRKYDEYKSMYETVKEILEKVKSIKLQTDLRNKTLRKDNISGSAFIPDEDGAVEIEE